MRWFCWYFYYRKRCFLRRVTAFLLQQKNFGPNVIYSTRIGSTPDCYHNGAVPHQKGSTTKLSWNPSPFTPLLKYKDQPFWASLKLSPDDHQITTRSPPYHHHIITISSPRSSPYHHQTITKSSPNHHHMITKSSPYQHQITTIPSSDHHHNSQNIDHLTSNNYETWPSKMSFGSPRPPECT